MATDVDERAADLLERAAKRVESGWCQGTEARDADGKPVDGRSQRAAMWCPLGAVSVECEFFTRSKLFALRSLRAACGCTVPSWNDAPGRTQAEVVGMMRKAAALLREGKR